MGSHRQCRRKALILCVPVGPQQLRTLPQGLPPGVGTAGALQAWAGGATQMAAALPAGWLIAAHRSPKSAARPCCRSVTAAESGILR